MFAAKEKVFKLFFLIALFCFQTIYMTFENKITIGQCPFFKLHASKCDLLTTRLKFRRKKNQLNFISFIYGCPAHKFMKNVLDYCFILLKQNILNFSYLKIFNLNWMLKFYEPCNNPFPNLKSCKKSELVNLSNPYL